MIYVITIEVFLIGLMAVSTLTGFVTEAIKKIITERNAEYRPNTIAGIVAAVLSTGIGVGYAVIMKLAFTGQIIVCIVALAFMGWLGAMVGYDKITDLLKKSTKKD